MSNIYTTGAARQQNHDSQHEHEGSTWLSRYDRSGRNTRGGAAQPTSIVCLHPTAIAAAASAEPILELMRALLKKDEDEQPFTSSLPANDGLELPPWYRFAWDDTREDTGDGRQDDGQGAGAFSATLAGDTMELSAEQFFACNTLADQLSPMAEDNGIFEVDLPGGERIGVVVNTHPEQVCFLLSPANAQVGGTLRRFRMELEERVERRIRRSVRVTVL